MTALDLYADLDLTPPDEKRRLLNEKHATAPQPGDYWHELYMPVCVVLEVTDTDVLICKTTKPTDPDHWTFDLEKHERKTLVDFKKWLAYGSIPGYWCAVMPKRVMWAVEIYKGAKP